MKYVKSVLCAVILYSVIVPGGWCQQKHTGIGISLGEPTGFSGKMWWSDTMAFDCGVAWSFAEDPSIHIHGDVLWHNWHVLDDAFEVDDNGRLPLYYGVGGRLKAGEDTRLGVRFVIGATYIFAYAPFDIFLEIAPIMDIAPETELQLNAALGTRFWF